MTSITTHPTIARTRRLEALVSSISSVSGSEGETDTSSNVDFGGSVLETPTDVGTELVTGTFSDSDTSSDTENDTSSDITNNNQGTTTETQVATSDQTQTESSTETSSGTDTFTGVVEDGSTYSGPVFTPTVRSTRGARSTTTIRTRRPILRGS